MVVTVDIECQDVESKTEEHSLELAQHLADVVCARLERASIDCRVMVNSGPGGQWRPCPTRPGWFYTPNSPDKHLCYPRRGAFEVVLKCPNTLAFNAAGALAKLGVWSRLRTRHWPDPELLADKLVHLLIAARKGENLTASIRSLANWAEEVSSQEEPRMHGRAKYLGTSNSDTSLNLLHSFWRNSSKTVARTQVNTNKPQKNTACSENVSRMSNLPRSQSLSSCSRSSLYRQSFSCARKKSPPRNHVLSLLNVYVPGLMTEFDESLYPCPKAMCCAVKDVATRTLWGPGTTANSDAATPLVAARRVTEKKASVAFAPGTTRPEPTLVMGPSEDTSSTPSSRGGKRQAWALIPDRESQPQSFSTSIAGRKRLGTVAPLDESPIDGEQVLARTVPSPLETPSNLTIAQSESIANVEQAAGIEVGVGENVFDATQKFQHAVRKVTAQGQRATCTGDLIMDWYRKCSPAGASKESQLPKEHSEESEEEYEEEFDEFSE